MKTVADRLANLDNEMSEKRARLCREQEILDMLPVTLPNPTISNLDTKTASERCPWVSFQAARFTDEKPYDASSVFLGLEAAGWRPQMLSIVKWGAYRRSIYPAHQNDLPDTYHNAEFKDSEGIVPLAIRLTLCQYNHDNDAQAYYRAPNGLLVHVQVEVKLPCSVNARRQYAGGHQSSDYWRFEHGTGKVSIPPTWMAIYPNAEESNPIATPSQYCQGYVDTEKSCSGMISWIPLLGQDDWKLTPGQFLKLLEDAAK